METTKVLTKEEIQAALEERHSPEKQKKLSEGRVTIAGLGGLGSNVAYALARIGVGHLHLIDFDVVDITNLNRQQYFTEHIGMYKTDALKSLLQKINPYIDIQTDCIKVTEYLQNKYPNNSYLNVYPAFLSGTECNKVTPSERACHFEKESDFTF